MARRGRGGGSRRTYARDARGRFASLRGRAAAKAATIMAKPGGKRAARKQAKATGLAAAQAKAARGAKQEMRREFKALMRLEAKDHGLDVDTYVRKQMADYDRLEREGR